MSNVLFRFRRVSELEFWKTGTEIRAIVTRYLMSENHVPKRWRPIFTFSGVDLARRLMEELTAANTIYPTTEAELSQRLYHQNEAINACEQIIQHMQWLIDTLPEYSKVSDFDVLIPLINKEIALIKGWRKQNRVLSHKW